MILYRVYHSILTLLRKAKDTFFPVNIVESLTESEQLYLRVILQEAFPYD